MRDQSEIHAHDCARPGCLWQQQILSLPIMGQCRGCGALAKRSMREPRGAE